VKNKTSLFITEIGLGPTMQLYAQYTIKEHRRTQDFTMEGIHVVGAGPRAVRSRGKAQVGVLAVWWMKSPRS